MTAIRVDGVYRHFDTHAALNGVDLEVRSGEFLALLGPSGSGKTTLLRILAGLDFADAGNVAFDGENVSALPVGRRQVGFVFQHYALFRHMTVAGNIAFGLTVRKRSLRPRRAEIAQRVEELLRLVQLDGLGRRYPAQLSGGQRQRVALARALAVEPRILLLDEPFGALDAKVRRDLRRWLRALHEEVGLTSVFVTHDQEEALELADRVVVMRDGRIEQIAAPATLYNDPATPFAFAFAGEASSLHVEVRGGAIWYAGAALPLATQDREDGPAELWFRPHDARLAGEGENGMRVTVASVRPRAGKARVEALAAGGKLLELDLPEPPTVGMEFSVLPTRYKLF